MSSNEPPRTPSQIPAACLNGPTCFSPRFHILLHTLIRCSGPPLLAGPGDSQDRDGHQEYEGGRAA